MTRLELNKIKLKYNLNQVNIHIDMYHNADNKRSNSAIMNHSLSTYYRGKADVLKEIIDEGN